MVQVSKMAALKKLTRLPLYAFLSGRTPLVGSFIQGSNNLISASTSRPLNFQQYASMSSKSEVQAAQDAAVSFCDKDEPTIFDKIIAKEIPADIVFEVVYLAPTRFS